MRICVFCGSSRGARGDYAQAARDFGSLVAELGISLVTGGGKVGLMGEVADAALARGGEVIGVIPRPLRDREVAHLGLSELRLVETMHERKAEMAALSDAFVALPGGIGTLEELFEVWSWAQLGLHKKPCALLDVAGYYAALAEFIEHAVRESFVLPAFRDLMLIEKEPAALLAKLRLRHGALKDL